MYKFPSFPVAIVTLSPVAVLNSITLTFKFSNLPLSASILSAFTSVNLGDFLNPISTVPSALTFVATFSVE